MRSIRLNITILVSVACFALSAFSIPSRSSRYNRYVPPPVNPPSGTLPSGTLPSGNPPSIPPPDDPAPNDPSPVSSPPPAGSSPPAVPSPISSPLAGPPTSTGSTTNSGSSNGGTSTGSSSGISGSAQVINNCEGPVYLKTVLGQDGAESGTTTIDQDGAWSQPFITEENNGLSIKVSVIEGIPNDNQLQLEYAVESGGATISWDISANNGNPFGDIGGFSYACTPDQPSETCTSPTADCPNVFPLGLGPATTAGTPQVCAITSALSLTVCG